MEQDVNPAQALPAATILLVEDDPGDQELTRRALEMGKIEVDLRIVEDGEQALDYLFHRGEYADPKDSPIPALVLLDLNLPKIDGKEVLRQIREDDTLRRLPVVALTTSKQEQDILKTYDLGVNSYIAKPVDMDTFVTTLRELGNYWLRVVMLPTI